MGGELIEPAVAVFGKAQVHGIGAAATWLDRASVTLVKRIGTADMISADWIFRAFGSMGALYAPSGCRPVSPRLAVDSYSPAFSP